MSRSSSFDGHAQSSSFGAALAPPVKVRTLSCATEGSRFRADFEILRAIGSGSFGTVHKVKSRLDGCLYAVKSTRARFKGPTHRDATLKEVFALAALSAASTQQSEALQHVVRYYQAWIEDERLFIQTELCDSSLEKRIEQRRFERSPKSVWAFLRQMLLALELLHSRGLVHLDIKPGNIFVSGEATYKLGDFGLAATANGQGDARSTAQRTRDASDLERFCKFGVCQSWVDTFSLECVCVSRRSRVCVRSRECSGTKAKGASPRARVRLNRLVVRQRIGDLGDETSLELYYES